MYFMPPLMLSSRLRGLTPSSFAVAGINCITPTAPLFALTAF
jgi:hypothetical protein